MAGRRILDVVALLNASRGVISKHLALRRQHLDLYGKTSPLASTITSQTERLALTASAAVSLARRTNDPGLSYSTQAGDKSATRPLGQTITNPQSLSTGSEASNTNETLGDHFYTRSEDSSATNHAADQDLVVKQEKPSRYPLPDGSILPSRSDIGSRQTDDDVYNTRPSMELGEAPLDRSEREEEPKSSGRSNLIMFSNAPLPSPHNANKPQSPTELQIPARTAEPPPKSSMDPKIATDEDVEGLGVGQEQDVFYRPSPDSAPVLSALPRVKVPKSTADSQEGDEHLPDDHTNPDVFYHSDGSLKKGMVSRNQTFPIKGEPGKNIKDISHSTGVTNLLEEDHNTLDMKKPGEDRRGESSPHLDPAPSAAKDATSTQVGGPELARDSIINTVQMQESRVPSSRFGRLWQYSGLATSMAFGAVGESLRRMAGSSSESSGPLMLSGGNMERLVTRLSRMRGAALKLGQMMSFQDSKMLPEPLHDILRRVQDSADYMPASQRNRVLTANLGSGWRDLFESFEEIPMAAASIGQVHGAILKSTGQRVAVKVQYPGVAHSIDSDLNNLSLLLTASQLLPKGLYLDKTIDNARIELAWECDYIREAEGAKRFRKLLKDEPNVFVVPRIIDEASNRQVLTMERMEGVAVTKGLGFSQEQKDWIGTQILRLCLREITEFRYMQTDPNWTNFLFNTKTQKLELLDFGASRDFPDKFIVPYVNTLIAASHNDRDACRELSIQLGYLTGHESQTMVNAHVASVLTLAEPFMDSAPDVYDFQDQTITDRVRAFIPVMVRERLSPPPEETYSLHRKLSGAFLLCARLGSRVRCKELFANAVQRTTL